MALNSNNARIFANENSRLYLGHIGNTMPTGLDLPTVATNALYDVGWLGEDGVDLDTEKEVQDYKGFQGGGVIRTDVKSTKKTLKLALAEDHAIARYIVNAGQGFTVTAGVAEQSIIANQSRALRMAGLLDLFDASIVDRYIFSALDLIYQGTYALGKNDALRVVAVEATIVAGSVALNRTNSPGVVDTAMQAAVTALAA